MAWVPLDNGHEPGYSRNLVRHRLREVRPHGVHTPGARLHVRSANTTLLSWATVPTHIRKLLILLATSDVSDRFWPGNRGTDSGVLSKSEGPGDSGFGLRPRDAACR